jgi:hypothetical protein
MMEIKRSEARRVEERSQVSGGAGADAAVGGAEDVADGVDDEPPRVRW